MLVLATLPFARLRLARKTLIAAAAWSLMCAGAAIVARRSGHAAPVTDALLGAFANLALPLCAHALTGAVVGRGSLLAARRSLLSVGASAIGASLAHLAVAASACALWASATSAVVVAIAHGPLDPPLAGDLVVALRVGALGGATLGAWLCAGACFGARGTGRSVALVVSWLFGGGALAVVSPTAHVASLLGGPAAAGMSQRASSVALVMLALLATGVTILRSRRVA